MTVGELYEYLNEKYPKALSCPWDNDGMMVCADPEKEVGRVLVALDGTADAVEYAAAHGFDVLLTHHPMIFRGAKNVTPMTLTGRRILGAVTGGVSVLSFHTRMDAGEGGVNDALCEALGFRVSGGFGDEEAPTLGRLVTISPGMALDELALHVKTILGAPFVRLTATDNHRVVTKLALCGGDGKDFTSAAISAGAEVLITGASGYNMAQDGAEEGFATIEAGHYHTERPICVALAETLTSQGLYCEIYDSCMETVL